MVWLWNSLILYCWKLLLWFKRCYNENLLKIIKNWTVSHFWRTKDVVMKFWKVLYLYKSFGKWNHQLSLCISKACKGMAYWFHRKCCEAKQTVTFEQLLEYEWYFEGIQMFMRAFCYSLQQVDSIFSSKVIILLNNHKSYLEIQRSLFFRCQWYGYQTFKLFDLNEDFPKLN